MAVVHWFSSVFSYMALALGIMLLVHAPAGLWGGVIWLPKLWASAWAPLIALFGALGALLGFVQADYAAGAAGLLGAALAIRHTMIVTKPHGGFVAAFGADWELRIPSELRSRLIWKRYRPIQPRLTPVPGERNVNLGNSLLCDIWQPPATVKRTGLALIYLHGGLWQAVDKDFLTQPLFRRLAHQGHIIMDVAYSLTPQANMTCMLRDVQRALLWMKEHASQYKVNPERVVLMGVSGGAHLALMAAYAPDHPAFHAAPAGKMRVRGVISMFGITDMAAFHEEYGRTNPRQPAYSSQITDDLRPRVHDKTWMDRFLTRSRAFPAYRHANMPGGALLLIYLMGGTLNEIPDVYRLASPIAHVGPHCPPTLQVFDEDDFVVDASHGQRLHQALCAAGVRSVYVEFPETVHGFDQYFGVSRRVAPAAQAATYDIERFLAMMV